MNDLNGRAESFQRNTFIRARERNISISYTLKLYYVDIKTNFRGKIELF